MPKSYVAQGLLRNKPLSQDISVTKTISNKGGVISLGSAGFQLVIPAGAFAEKSLTFTVTAHAGSTVAYDFEPHGHAFLQPLTFQQNLSATNLKNAQLPKGFVLDLAGAYFPSATLVDPTTGLSVVTERITTDLKATVDGNQLSFPIWHFSGYLVSTGRDDDGGNGGGGN